MIMTLKPRFMMKANNKLGRRARFAGFAITLAFIWTAAAVSPANGQVVSLDTAGDRVTVSVQWSQQEARPGDQRVLAVVFEAKQGWHINPQFARARSIEAFRAIGTEVGFERSRQAGPNQRALRPPRQADGRVSNMQFGSLQWPEPHRLDVGYVEDNIPAYTGKTVVYLPVMVSDDAEPGTLQIPLKVRYQSCDDQQCLRPVTESLNVEMEIVSEATTAAGATSNHDDAGLFEGFDSSAFAQMQQGSGGPNYITFNAFGWLGEEGIRINAGTWLGFGAMLIIAAVGGMLLNFTPCVLPVIPLKVMGLANSAGSRRRTLMLGSVMAAGVAGFWLMLGLMISSVSAVTSANQLFQYPAFTITMGLVIAIMAVGMCGLFTIQLPKWVYTITPNQESSTGSFGFGMMTAVLSTPCTAPFMGAAAGWAAVQSPIVSLSTFLAIGIGMAAPYFVLSAFPQLANRMPRTGPGSEVLKQVLGLLMLAAATFFVGSGLSVWLNQPPDPPSLAYWWGVGGFVAAAGFWLIVRVFQITGRLRPRIIWASVGAFAILCAGVGANALDSRGPINWRFYTPQRFENAKSSGKVVVMDFTADWCLNCKALEHSVLFDQRVVEALDQRSVTPIKVDITSRSNEAGWSMLKKMDRVTIPLLVVFAPDGEVVFTSDAYEVGQVLSAIEEATSEGYG
jgi:thiol:disulfide interchange protein DsbD